ncbi:uncharacterized protein LOC117583412 isoform X1 [Drosophila guanche]|uniref:Uncharacterized protein n=1 Tax=Drosophila guanche TaxID=7266 RepID=A0A3B0JF15_DROGU|nr:uncharacterized protein LOC117583412 isoform X1 [Drosophila guanche]SPP80715.1 Hypothetical predicted protein [Drosophila guanche]
MGRTTYAAGWLLGFWCLVCLAAAAQGSSSSSSSRSVGASATLLAHKDVAHMHKLKRQQDKHQQTLQLQLQQGVTGVAGTKQQPKKQLSRSAHGLNKKLLGQMGFMKVKAPNSHNRKRLAVESRRHASRDDSHMFIIKLPPNMHYYAGPNANAVQNAAPEMASSSQKGNAPSKMEATAAAAAASRRSATQATAAAAAAAAATATEASALKANGKKVSFPFSSNGRPGRIYHWNLPVLKQALQKKPHFAHVSASDRNRLLDIEKIPTWRKPWENETIEKSITTSSGKSKYKKSLKPKSPTYYAPSQAVSKQSFHKYFAGNGKPKGFYVIKEHQSKPQFYHNIIS